MRNSIVITCLPLVGLFLMGCESDDLDFAGDYSFDNTDIEISKGGQVSISENLTTMSSLNREMSIVSEDDEPLVYKMNPNEDYIWTYTIHKLDPDYDGIMDEMLYYVEHHNFTTKDSNDYVVVSGAFDDDYFGEFGISYDDPVITDSNDGLYFYRAELTEK